MKLLKFLIALIYTAGLGILCQQIIVNSFANQQNKVDYAELNDIKYGMLNVEEWKNRLTGIISKEFDRLYVSDKTEKELREHIAVVLEKMIDEAALKIQKSNEKTATGKMKQLFIDMFVDVKDIKKGVPEYTDAVIEEMKKKKTKQQMKSIVNAQIAEFATKTADTQDRSQLLEIYRTTGTDNITDARAKVDQLLVSTSDLIVKQTIALILLVTIPFLWLAIGRKSPSPILFTALSLSLLFMLAVGVSTPMIDMEAKISQLKFILIGHTIQFDNQVLYFQSKSILNVFWVMMTHGQLQMKAVGILLVTFSVLFPLLKLLTTTIYYCNIAGLRKNSLINFFVFNSGKWSMTDVMVIAIFMAYIGFNGIIESQLKSLSSLESGASILTTNGTSLQPGYYVFFAYALFALFLSGYLKKSANKSNKTTAEP